MCPYCGTPVAGMRQESIDMDKALQELELNPPADDSTDVEPVT
jgi:hypothetical protein